MPAVQPPDATASAVSTLEPLSRFGSERRTLLTAAAAAAGTGLLAGCTGDARHPEASDVARISHARLGARLQPDSTEAVQAAVTGWSGQICLAGGRFSMGGQTMAEHALQLDLTGLDKLIWLDPENQRVRVQAGMRWHTLQALIDPHDLSVKVMQSYANFTIGGSVSVNCHGRYVNAGPISGTVRALQLVDASGVVHELSRISEPALFSAVLGGYGGLGVVTEVELELARNEKIARHVQRIALDDYPDWFAEHVLADPDAVLHNADLLPPSLDAPIAVTWRRSRAALTDPRRLTPLGAGYGREQSLIWLATEAPGGAKVRGHYQTEPLLHTPRVVMRNLEASLDTASLEPRTRQLSTYLLQEYFIPVARFSRFAGAMRRILQQHDALPLNISIRHSPADPVALMAWARGEVFSFVLYLKQRQWPWSDHQAISWTRALIDAALECGGCHYLPYRPHATREQFLAAYPMARQLAALKRTVDPQGTFTSQFWQRYLGGL